MSEDYTEEFVVEEEEGPNRRFLIIAGSLIGLFIIIAACTLGYFLIQNGGGDDEVTDEAVAIRLTENAQTNIENTRVVQTVEALTREAAAAPEDTPTPRPTLAPTNTPMSEVEAAPPGADSTADAGEDGEDTGDGEAEATPPSATSDAAAPPGGDTDQDTPTPTLAPVTPAAPSESDELPQTGIETVSLVLAGFVLISLLLIARRLRSN